LTTADFTVLALELIEQQVPFCLATVVLCGNASGVEIGQKLIARAGGPSGEASQTIGAVGGSQLTTKIEHLAVAQISAGDIRLVRLSSSGEMLPDRRSRRGMEPTPDELEVVLEPVLPLEQLIIVGAGHIAVPLARMAAVVGFEVTVIDDRERFANRDRFPEAAEIVVQPFEQAIAAQTITAWTYLVLVTRGHEHDEATLRQVVGSPAPYIGMIGSRRRVLVVFERLRAMGMPEEFIKRIYAPIGLDLGARTAEEIALAILAEIVTVKRRGRALPLRDLAPQPSGLSSRV